EKNKGICLVVEKENEIGGMIIGRKNKVTKNCVTLSALLVGDDLRGQGLAKKLAEMFMKKVFTREENLKIELHFRDSNNLQNFYEKLGFEKHCVCGKYKNGEKKHYMEISRDDIMKTNH
ncbi:MAG: GNAT family N-acetyltransferase, partial [Candidatus Moranbacteria bacterium]|nr:GNAT family N-acetyltransferase [Candidatus Moranbacteria bacterium]